MKSILIITQYYPPETGAASNRICQLAEGLAQRGYNVSVTTPLPNYPTGKVFTAYKGNKKNRNIENGVEVHRLWIYPSNSKNKLLRLFSMLSYSISLIWFFITSKIPKTIIVQSPPLIVAFTCMLFLRKKNRNLILNVSDLWPLAGLELGAFKRNFSYRVLERIERFNYRRANLILGQSEEIIRHIKAVCPDKLCFLYRNFPDFEVIINGSQNPSTGKIKLVYAGLLGVAQGVLELCKQLDTTKVNFHIYGSGQEANAIATYVNTNPEKPIYFHGHLSRSELHQALLSYDITIVPLLTRIYGSVPSKIFEYARLGMPILYVGGGEGEDLVKHHKLGWVASAGNYNELNAVISNLKPGDLNQRLKSQIRQTAFEHFDFNAQLDRLLRFL